MKQKIISLLCLSVISLTAGAGSMTAIMDWADRTSHSFVVNGVIEQVHVKEGQSVKTGEVLAKLDTKPFNYAVKACESAIAKIQPTVFDAKIEYDQAEELFERTVLSEIELQKIEGAYKSLLAEQNMLKANCDIQKWKAKKAKLTTDKNALVYSVNMLPGQVVSDESQPAYSIELVSAVNATAQAFVSPAERSQFKLGQVIKVMADDLETSATVESLSVKPNNEGLYRLRVKFPYSQVVVPGRTLQIRF